MNEELKKILARFSKSGWELIAVPSARYLSGENCRDELVSAIAEADKECGSCGCEFDPLYKRFLELSDLLA